MTMKRIQNSAVSLAVVIGLIFTPVVPLWADVLTDLAHNPIPEKPIEEFDPSPSKNTTAPPVDSPLSKPLIGTPFVQKPKPPVQRSIVLAAMKFGDGKVIIEKINGKMFASIRVSNGAMETRVAQFGVASFRRGRKGLEITTLDGTVRSLAPTATTTSSTSSTALTTTTTTSSTTDTSTTSPTILGMPEGDQTTSTTSSTSTATSTATTAPTTSTTTTTSPDTLGGTTTVLSEPITTTVTTPTTTATTTSPISTTTTTGTTAPLPLAPVREIKLTDGHTFVYDLKTNTGFHVDGVTRDPFTDIHFMKNSVTTCPADPRVLAPCSALMIDWIHPVGNVTVGMYIEKVEKDGWITTTSYTITGRPDELDIALKDLSTRLMVPVGGIQIGNIKPREWPDSCLGLGGADEVCAQVITPGYRIELVYNQGTKSAAFVYHTDMQGNVRLNAMESAAAMIDLAKADLTKRTGIPADQIKVTSAELVMWPDSCLGIPTDGVCLAVMTPGYRLTLAVVVSGSETIYTYHTDLFGVVRLALVSLTMAPIEPWWSTGGVGVTATVTKN